MIIELNSESGFTTYYKQCSKVFDSFSREVGWVILGKVLQEEIKKGRSKLLISTPTTNTSVKGSLLCYKRVDGSIKITAIAVLKEHQGQGIGKELVDYLLPNKIEVACLEDIEANNFYKSLNFKLYSTKLSKKGSKINIYRNYE